MMFAVAIDGPGGAGKSTTARALASRLGFIYVDTGALYRAIGLSMKRKGVCDTDADMVCAALKDVEVSLAFQNGEQRVMLNGEDVSGAIRTPEISMAASHVSAIPGVRSFLFDLQKNLALKNNVIMDGRDIGTVVLPDAQVKVFLTASPEERARRRCEEMRAKGQDADYQSILEDLRIRDDNDTNRDIAPLVPAADAVQLDTTGKTQEQCVEELVALVRLRMGKQPVSQ